MKKIPFEMTSHGLSSYFLVAAFHVWFAGHFASGYGYCSGPNDCQFEQGYTCRNNECVCTERASFCSTVKSFGERCSSDHECAQTDSNLYCSRSEPRLCRCQRAWDAAAKKCFTGDENGYNGKMDPIRELILPAIIIMVVAGMIFGFIRLFCTCGKNLCRRRRPQEITRELEEMNATPHQQATWIASYRVFSPYNNASRPSSGLSPTSFPIHPTPCMGLFVPSQSLSTSPPPYEEALKHKVILSSYHTSGPPVVPAYSLPLPDVSRQYQTLPTNASGPSSTIILNPNAPTASTIRISTVSGPRSLPVTQTENYPGLSSSHDQVWTQLQYSGTTGQIWSPHHRNTIARSNPDGTDHCDSVTSEIIAQHSRAPQSMEVWTPQQPNARTNVQQLPQSQTQQSTQSQQSSQQQQPLQHDMPPRTSTFRPGQAQRTYQTSVQNNSNDN